MMPPETHAKISPSRLQRILDCPGSFALTQKYENEQSSYAAEGSHLHLATEMHLREHLANDKWMTEKVDPAQVDPPLDSEQVYAVEDCILYLKNLYNSIDGPVKMVIEERVYLKGYNQVLYECDGTCDIILKTPDELHAVDWKFGQGVPVYADKNDQLMSYLAGAAEDYEVLQSYKMLNIHVVQPRLDNYDHQPVTVEEMIFWLGSRVIPGVIKAYEKHAPFNPGKKQCRWCPAKMSCRARYNFAQQTAADVFGAALELPDVVSQEELAAIYARGLELSQYVKDIGVHIQKTLERGIPWPGYKMVAGRSSRKWNVSEAEVIDFLDEHDVDMAEMFKSKLVSPPQAEKLDRTFKKDAGFQALIEKTAGKPTMVTEGDKRQAQSFRTAAEIFGGAE